MGIVIVEIYFRKQGITLPVNHPISIDFMTPTKPLVPDSILGVDLRDGDFKVTLNSGLAFTASHTKGERRSTGPSNDSAPTIWLYGCSFFYGFGLPDSQVVGAQLSSLLPAYCVRNRAVPGYGNVQMYLKMKVDQSQWRKGDVVILTYASFHTERNVMALSYRNKLHTFGRDKLADLRFPMIVEKEGMIGIKYEPFDYPAYPLRELSSVFYGLELMRNRLMDDFEKAEAISHEFIAQVANEFMDKPYHFAMARLSEDEPTKTLFDTLAFDGIQTIDVSLNFSDTTYNLMPLDVHPNHVAHSYFADQIANELQNHEY